MAKSPQRLIQARLNVHLRRMTEIMECQDVERSAASVQAFAEINDGTLKDEINAEYDNPTTRKAEGATPSNNNKDNDPDYSSITDEEFDRALLELIEEATASTIMGTTGAYEVFSEEWNNDALDRALANKNK